MGATMDKEDHTLMRSFWLASLTLIALASLGQAQENTPQVQQYIVTYVYDGDTVKLHPKNTFSQKYDIKLRITQMDAPERNQPFGLKARRALIKLCQGNNIVATADIVAKDKYQRSLGRLQCNQVDASLYMVEQGLAWHDDKYAHDWEIAQAQDRAKEQKLGLWADGKAVMPWVWRKMHVR